MAFFGGVSTRRSIPRSAYQLGLFLIVFFGSVAVLALNPDVRAGLGGIFSDTASSLKQMAATTKTVVRKEIVAVPAARTDVLIPIRNIKSGEKLHPALFKIEGRPVEGMRNKVVTKIDDIRGKHTNSLLVAGTPLLKAHVTQKAAAGSVVAEIPQGYRAVAIAVDAESGVEGWVQPGVHVDVVWSTQHRGKALVTTIVENAQVISAARKTQAADPNAQGMDEEEQAVPSFVTLMVPSKDAQKIQLAKKAEGSLSLSMRGAADRAENGGETMTVDQLFRQGVLASLEADQGKVRIGQESFVVRGGELVRPEATDAKASWGASTVPADPAVNSTQLASSWQLKLGQEKLAQ